MFFFPLSKSFEGILCRKLALRIVEIAQMVADIAADEAANICTQV